MNREGLGCRMGINDGIYPGHCIYPDLLSTWFYVIALLMIGRFSHRYVVMDILRLSEVNTHYV